MKRHLILITILAVFILGMSTVFAQPEGMRNRMFQDDDFPEFTAEQRDKMGQLRTDFQKATIPLRADLRLKQVELRELMRTEASQSMINSKLDEIGALKTQLSKLKIDHRLKAKSVMTDQQRQYFEEHRGMMRMHNKAGRGCDGRGDRRPHRGRDHSFQRGDGLFGGRGDCFFDYDLDDNDDSQ